MHLSKADTHTGAMVALYPSPILADQLAQDGGEKPEDLHVTLAYLGNAADLQDPDAVHQAVQAWAEQCPPLAGQISGTGQFTAGPEPVTYASVDMPGLGGQREQLGQALTAAGAPPSADHGFTPHMTLAYDDRSPTVPNHPLVFDHATVALAGKRTTYPLTGIQKGDKMADEISNAPWSGDASHFSDEQWKASCILDRGATNPTVKRRYAVPVREPDGTLNRKGLAAAQGALNGARGGVTAPPAAITAAKAKLRGLYTEAGLAAKAEWDVPIWKADDGDELTVYGVVLQPGIEDSQGDVVSAAEIEKAAHRFMLESRRSDVQHNEQQADVHPVESFVAPHDLVVAGKPVLKGAWVVASLVRDVAIAKDVREDRLTGYSMGGSAVRVAKSERTPVAKAADLQGLVVDWVSLVDRAATRDTVQQSEPQRFLVWKRDDPTPQGGTMTPEEQKAALDKAQADLKAANDALATEKTEKAELAAKVATLEKAAKPVEPASAAEIDKSELPPAVRAALEKAEADSAAMAERLEKAEKATKQADDLAKAERDARVTREFITKAETFKALPIKAAEFGPILKAASETLTKEQFDALDTVLKAADAQIAAGDLFKEQGRSGEGAKADTALAEVTQKAAELRKSDSKLSMAAAMDQVFAADTALQSRYLAETR